MRHPVRLALLASATAALVTIPAAASGPHTNGRIAYVRSGATGEDYVYTSNADGSHEQRLLATGAEQPHWSPEGSRVAVSPHDSPAAARIVNVDDGSFRDVAQPDPSVFLPCPLFSADGASLVCEGFGTSDPSLNGIYSIRSSDGQGVRRITANPGGDDFPGGFSPDGRHLVFIRLQPDGAHSALFVADVGPGRGPAEARRLTPPGLKLQFFGGRWSPYGDLILFSARRGAAQLNAIFVIRADGTGLRRLPIRGCGLTSGCFSPSWSPDGRKVVLSVLRQGATQADLYTARGDGGGLTPIVTTPDFESSAAWGTHPVLR